MKAFGRPGDRWGLARVYGAMVIATVVGAILGYAIDLVIGPLVGQSGWWTVFAFGGTIAGAMVQGVREYAVPLHRRA